MATKRERTRAKQFAIDPPWTPFQRATPYLQGVKQDIKTFGGDALFKNSRYTVMLRKIPAVTELMSGDELEANMERTVWPAMVHLSIRRNDRGAARDWRDFQRIKNELVGTLNEAVELYPSEERLVDGANQFHLWVLADVSDRFPFGFQTRSVAEDVSDTPNAVQRPFTAEVGPV